MKPGLRSNTTPVPTIPETTASLFSWLVDTSCPSDRFFHKDIFDFLPFDDFDTHETISPSLLHLSGYAREFSQMFTRVDPFRPFGSFDFEEFAQQGESGDGYSTAPSLDTDLSSCSDDSSISSDSSDSLHTFTGTKITTSQSVHSASDASSDASTLQGEPPSDLFTDVDTWLSFNSQRLLDPELARVRDHLQPSRSTVLVPKEYNQALIEDPRFFLRNHHAVVADDSQNRVFPVLIDTGCSTALTGFKEDFGGVLIPGDFGIIKTANGLATLQGFGLVTWTTVTPEGITVKIRVPSYYAEEIPLRLFSPQDYAAYHKHSRTQMTMMGNADWFSFRLEPEDESTPDYVTGIKEPSSRLFFFHARSSLPDVPVPCSCDEQTTLRATHHASAPVPVVATAASSDCNDNVLSESNMNLSQAQKDLLLDHQRLGHFRFGLVQSLYTCDDEPVPFLGDIKPCTPCLVAHTKSMISCPHPKCATCQYARARRRTPNVKSSTPNPETVPSIRAEDLNPGDQVSVDQYESSVRGRLPNTRGRESSTRKYVGGTLFYDHASGKIFAQHQVSLDGPTTQRAKHTFENEARFDGVEIKKYHMDNGSPLTSKEFTETLDNEEDPKQDYRLSGVGAKHQNAVAERAIGTVQNMARAMLLHFRIFWPDEFDSGLWPFALDYAVWIYNHTPTKERASFSPEELFTRTKTGCKMLRRCRVFGCPAYVLDARLQDGKKIPKWSSRARTGVFLGFSKRHSSLVANILNVKTGHISPQFHVVYDEKFQTVCSDRSFDLSETWIDLWKNGRDFYLDGWDSDLDGEYPKLTGGFDADDTDDQDDFDRTHAPKEGHVRNPTRTVRFDPDSELRDGWSTDDDRDDDPEDVPPDFNGDDDLDEPDVREVSPTASEETQGGSSEATETAADDHEEYVPDSSDAPSPAQTDRRTRSQTRSQSPTTAFIPTIKKEGPVSYRSIKSRLFSHVRSANDVSNLVYATLDWETVNSHPLYAYFDELFTSLVDIETQELLDPDQVHPFSLSAKLESEDYPTFKEIMRMDKEERDQWFDSMDEELSVLFKSGACEFVDRQEVLRLRKEIVKSTWAFRQKRKPSGEIYRKKSRVCVRGDLQVDKDSYGPEATFAPVVEWLTIRMLFTLGLVENWKTASIDFKNAFTQAQLPEPIYLELPPGYKEANPDLKDKLIRVNTSLYGDVRAANLWYRKVAKTLTEKLGFKISEIDPCLFIRDDCIMVLWVDDAVLLARSEDAIEKVFSELRQEGYAFDRDEDFNSYLGIKIEHPSPDSMRLTQKHLTSTFLDCVGMPDCNPMSTPSSAPLFRHTTAEPAKGFNYRSAIGILQYLCGNTRPDIAYATNSCAKYCVDPREPHEKAVKRIARYLKGTMDEGLIYRPDMNNLTLDCHVDADFAGTWNIDDPEDAEGVKSRTGFLLTFAGCPILWKSTTQSVIALSTMESEYIAMSTAMRSLVHARALLSEICNGFNMEHGDKVSTISTVFEDNRAAKILATVDPPRLTPRSKSLALRYHWFRSHLGVKDGKGIVVKDVASALNKADFLTKGLPPEHFKANRLAVCGW